jgi:transcriptional regulator with XRE-family HTH domain
MNSFSPVAGDQMFTVSELEFGQRMRQRRLANALSEELAASALGVSTQQYRALEAGAAKIDARQLRDASMALSAQAAELFAVLSRRPGL